MENNEKITRKEYFNILKEVIEANEVEGKEDILNFLNKEIDSIEKRKLRDKARTEAKRELNCEINEEIYNLLTDEFQTGEEIFEKLGDESITKNAIFTRLTQLVNEGRVEKREQKVEGKRHKIKGYRKI